MFLKEYTLNGIFTKKKFHKPCARKINIRTYRVGTLEFDIHIMQELFTTNIYNIKLFTKFDIYK